MTCSRPALATALAATSLLTMCAVATPASADTVSASAGGAKVVCTSKKPGLAAQLAHDMAGALAGREGTSSLALYDRASGTTCGLKADTHFDSASVVKVSVLGALLRQAEEAQRKLTPHEVELTTAMITKSDNEATSALWHQIGSAGFKKFLALAHMDHTVPGTGRSWGLTQITAGDQLRLMQLLTTTTTENTVLAPSSRSYALDLMNQVVPGQRWGVPAGSPATATVHVKNGWLPRATDGWRVNSVGAFTGSGHDYGMVVLSTGNRTMDYGVATVEGAARLVHRDLAAAAATASR
ncbi:serine hydrolase [Streptomyces sp. NPDC056230]|uniref:serine hydrolase n=1 Tax=Streptomyces sp. NPDC056230 TaxID=3345754 RepID=UPI0035E127B8